MARDGLGFAAGVRRQQYDQTWGDGMYRGFGTEYRSRIGKTALAAKEVAQKLGGMSRSFCTLGTARWSGFAADQS